MKGQREEGRGRCMDLSCTLSSIYFFAMGVGAARENSSLPAGLRRQDEVLVFSLEADEFTILLLTRKTKEPREKLEQQPWRKRATTPEGQVLAENSHHSA